MTLHNLTVVKRPVLDEDATSTILDYDILYHNPRLCIVVYQIISYGIKSYNTEHITLHCIIDHNTSCIMLDTIALHPMDI